MSSDSHSSEASDQYAAAHTTHYAVKNLPAALELYRNVVNAHPNAPEAEYSRSQIQNIVNSVVPKHDLLNASIELALAHSHEERADDDIRATTWLPTDEQ